MTLPALTEQDTAYECTKNMGSHGYDAVFHMQTDGMTMRYDTQRHQSIDHIIDLAIHYGQRHSPNLTLQVLPAIRPLPEEAKWRNHVRIDLKPQHDAASLMITTATDPMNPSSWIPKTETPKSDEFMRDVFLCWDTWVGAESGFPADSIITIPELRTVVHQFYDLTGVGLPAAVAWQQLPESMW